MTTLKEYEALIDAGGTAGVKAGQELSRFFIVYNKEYNALQDKLAEAEIAYYQVTHSDTGINQAEAMRLQAFMYSVKSRMKILDLKMRAFTEEGIEITAPSLAIVDEIKKLADQLSKLIARDAMLADVTASLQRMAELANP